MEGALQKSVTLFRRLTSYDIQCVFEEASLRQVGAGETICTFGEPSEEFYVLLSGEAEADLAGGEGIAERIVKITAGEVLGEVGVLMQGPRTATVKASSKCELLVFDGEILENIINNHPRAAARLNFNLARALGRRMHQRTSQSGEWRALS